MAAFWWTHAAPIGPLTPEHAHTIMQMHLECRVEDCPRKSAAFRALVEAGRDHAGLRPGALSKVSGRGVAVLAPQRAIDSKP